MKPIRVAFILVNASSCQQPVGWFDQLDPQWNITQCVLDKVIIGHAITLVSVVVMSTACILLCQHILLQVVTYPQQKITVTWTTMLSCNISFRLSKRLLHTCHSIDALIINTSDIEWVATWNCLTQQLTQE